MSESPRQEATESSASNDNSSSVECPTCGRSDFASRYGLKQHHAKAHNDPIRKTIDCDICGDSFDIIPHREGRAKYCSIECRREATRNITGEERYNYGKIERNCDWCGDSYKRPPCEEGRTRFCSTTCHDKYRSEMGTMAGENNPRWSGGSTLDGYSGRWNRQRRKALERDDYKCVVCGRGERELGRKPDVHHIRPVRDYDDENDAHDLLNLVTLCREHHQQWEGLYLRPDPR